MTATNNPQATTAPSYAELSTNWDQINSTLTKASSSSRSTEVLYAKDLANYIVQLQTKPSWWSEQVKQEQFAKLSKAVQSQFETVEKQVALAASKVFAQSPENLFQASITQKAWKAVFQMVESATQQESAPQWLQQTDLQQLLTKAVSENKDFFNGLSETERQKIPGFFCRLNLQHVATNVINSWFATPKEKAALFCATVDNDAVSQLLIDSLDIDYNNQEPMAKALSVKKDKLVLALCKRGASVPSFDAFKEAFGQEPAVQLFNAIIKQYPIEQERTLSLFFDLCHSKHLEQAHALLDRIVKTTNPQQGCWFKNPGKLAKVFFALGESVRDMHSVPDNLINDLKTLTGQIDLHAKDRHGQTPLMYVAQILKSKAFILGLVQNGASLSDEALVAVQGQENLQQSSSFNFIVKTVGLFTTAEEKKELLTIAASNKEAPHLYTVLLKEGYREQTEFLMRKIEEHPPQWWNTRAKTTLFFELIRTLGLLRSLSLGSYVDALNTVQCRLASSIDPAEVDFQNNHKTALILALEYNFYEVFILTLLPHSNLFHIDSTGKSAFSLLCEKKSISFTSLKDKLVTTFAPLGVTENSIRACTTYDELNTMLTTFINTASNPIMSRMFLLLVYGKTAEATKLLQQEKATITQRLEYIRAAKKIGGAPLQELLINCSFGIDFNHLQIVPELEKIPSKTTYQTIETELLSLYDSIPNKQDATATRAALTLFAQKIMNKTALGIAATDTFSYTTIDDAICNTVEHIKGKIAALVIKKNQPFATLVASRDSDALELVDISNSFLNEVISASGLCGGKLMSTARQQYSVVVHNKKLDLKSSLLEALALQRETIASTLVSHVVTKDGDDLVQQPQLDPESVHAYNQFLKESGKTFAIPGFSQMEHFDDPWGHFHKNQAAYAAQEFLSHYIPSFIVQAVQTALQDGELHEKFVTELHQQASQNKDWYDLTVPKIIKELQQCLNVTNEKQSLSAQQQAQVAAYFLQHSYVVMLASDDFATLESIGIALKSDPGLYVSCNKTGTTAATEVFSKEAIIRSLSDMHILSTEVLPVKESRAIYDLVYRDLLLKKLKDSEWDLSKLTELEQTQLKCAGKLITELYLHDCQASEQEMNDRLPQLLTIFPNIVSLILSHINISSIPILPAGLKQVGFRSCTHIAFIGSNVFSQCTALENASFENCSFLTQFNCTLPTGLKAVNFSCCFALASIGSNVFSQCNALENADFGWSGLTEFNCTLPAGLKKVDFNWCKHLTSIGANVFSQCSALEKVEFSYCSALTEFNCTLPKGLKKIDFNFCERLASIGVNVFSQCSALEEADFEYCSALTEFNCTLPAGLKKVDFYHCTHLTSIGSNVFSQCKYTINKISVGNTALSQEAITALKNQVGAHKIQL